MSERNVGVLGNDQVSFFCIGSLIVADDVFEGFHCGWDQSLESLLGHTVGKTSDTIGTVLSNIKMIFIIGTGPFANLDKLTANLINHHLVLDFTFFDEIDEEEGGVLDLLWRDNLVLGHDGSVVWLDARVHDSGRILLINRHYDVATFSNIGSGTCNLINGSLDGFQILLVDLGLALFLLNLCHVNFLLFGDVLQASLHKFSKGFEFGSRFKESAVIVVLHDSHAVEEFFEVEFQVFEASFFASSGKDMKGELIKELVEESLVSRRLLGEKDVLEGLQGIFAEDSSVRE